MRITFHVLVVNCQFSNRFLIIIDAYGNLITSVCLFKFSYISLESIVLHENYFMRVLQVHNQGSRSGLPSGYAKYLVNTLGYQKNIF